MVLCFFDRQRSTWTITRYLGKKKKKHKTRNDVQRNIVERSQNHCCRGKSVLHTCVCVRVRAGARRACSLTNLTCNAPPHCHLWRLWFHHIFRYLINDTIFGKKSYSAWNVYFYFLILRIQWGTVINGAWGSVVVKALRCQSEGLGIDPQWCRWQFFPKLPTEPCALGSTQPLKISTRKTPGGEGSRCVMVTTLPPSQCRKSRRSRSLNLLEPQEPHQACAENLYLYLTVINVKKSSCKITYYSCLILTKTEISPHIFEKSSSIIFHQNPSSGSRVVPCEQIDGPEYNSRFSQFCKRA
jgi:hypothetical protein